MQHPCVSCFTQKQFSRTLSNKQLAVILENMLDKQRYRQAAQVLEGLGERFASMGETVTTLVKDYSFAHEKVFVLDCKMGLKGCALLLVDSSDARRTTRHLFARL